MQTDRATARAGDVQASICMVIFRVSSRFGGREGTSTAARWRPESRVMDAGKARLVVDDLFLFVSGVWYKYECTSGLVRQGKRSDFTKLEALRHSMASGNCLNLKYPHQAYFDVWHPASGSWHSTCTSVKLQRPHDTHLLTRTLPGIHQRAPWPEVPIYPPGRAA